MTCSCPSLPARQPARLTLPPLLRTARLSRSRLLLWAGPFRL